MTLIAEVVVDVRTKSLDRTFDYRVDDAIRDTLKVGHRVWVPFGKSRCQGYVVHLKGDSPMGPQMDDSRFPLKSILSTVDDEPLLTPELLELANWMCYRYVCTRLEAIEAILPAVVRQPKSNAPSQTLILRTHLTQSELMSLANRQEKRAPKQAAVLRLLAKDGEIRLAGGTLRASDSSVKALVSQGYAAVLRVDEYREVAAGIVEPKADGIHGLTAFQERALLAIQKQMNLQEVPTMVVHGVTGSGKTEVYLRAIAACLAAGWEAIVLVPEISLTPQMVGRFTARFGPSIAVLHSGLNQSQRRDEWLRLARGNARIAVGARSAVFAPLQRVRLIIIDEEHETSYKQDETPHYDAREVAVWRRDFAGGVVVMGSATPSLTAMHTVGLGAAQLVSLPTRVNGQSLPPVEIVDMREELRQGNKHVFSRALQGSLEQSIASGGQAILFLNRRGFASFLLCRNCGDILQCPSCDISLTLHKSAKGEWLSCHYCGHRVPVPSHCPACDDEGLRPFGIGTQAVEQAVHELWPNFRLLRMDVDTTRTRGAHQRLLQTFQDGEADVLIGTQMVAKGLDFPRVTFVGVIAADTMLAIPDYRSAERTFNLLTQVAGRAGRADLAGKTVIQTFRPEHYAIQAAGRHDYSSFYHQETAYRATFDYPPYCEIATFLAVHEAESYAKGAAMRFERELRRGLQGEQATILPASPAVVSRAQDLYRYQVVLKYSSWAEVRSQVVEAFRLVYDKIHRLNGYCVLDVNAGRM